MKAKKALAVIGIVLIIGIMAVVFTACNNSTYQEKLKEAGYVITDISDILPDKDKVEWAFEAYHPTTLDSVSVIKYKSLKDAKAAEEAAIKGVESLDGGKEWSNWADAINSSKADTVERQSMLLFVGTAKAVEIAK